MEYAEDRIRRRGQYTMRLFAQARPRDLFDWDLAYRKAADALQPKNRRG